MRQSTIGLILMLLVLTSVSCQDSNTAPPAPTVSPQATAVIGVTFATLTPGASAGVATDAPERATLPPPTATATPTPVIYLVQAGDTLVGIAAARSITLDELLALNPDVQPELLMVGQEIVLPAALIIETPVPVVPGRDIAVEIDKLSTFNAVAGGMWVLGEVHHTGQLLVELVQVAITLLGQEGAEVASQTLWVTPVTLMAGGRAPFGVLFPEENASGSQVEVSVIGGRPVYELGNRYLDLAVVDAEVTIGRNPIGVAGRLENIGELPAGQISIITTFYDERGFVTGYHELLIDDVIMPGESAPFDIIALPPGGRADGYDFAVQAFVAS